MIALLHDFGYPIEKISGFPQQVNDTLKKFGVDFGSIFQIETGSGVALLFEPVSEIISTMTRPKGLTDEEDDLLKDISYELKELKGQPLRKISCEVEGVSREVIESDERIIIKFKGEDEKFYYKPIEQTGVLIQGQDGKWYCYTPKRLTEGEKTLLNPMSRRLVGQENNNGISWKIFRPTTIANSEEQEYEFKIAFARKKHPAWSAIYAFSNIAYLHMGSLQPGGGHDYLHLLTVKDILYSIVHHAHEAPTDYMMNRFSFILLLMDDIEEIGRYSKGGKPRGMELSRCNIRWKVDGNHTVIVFDYSAHEGTAKEQFGNLRKKYENQQCKPNSECSKCDRYKHYKKDLNLEQYIITIRLVDEEQTKCDFKMCLWRDAQ